ncbi:MAG: FAA hydrolase family protein [Planctomycetota bacterium]|nr:MAG: FAA hydrolase family protein [Planctomycetota bacterium]
MTRSWRLFRRECLLAVEGAGPGGTDLPLVLLLGVGRNYAAHAKERGAEAPARPMLFAKNPACAILHDEAIRVPRLCREPEQVDYEGELALVVREPIRDATEERALAALLGVCCANDVSARWWQKEGAGGQFHRGKSFDTFCPLGPRVVSLEEVGDPGALQLTTRLNGQVVQRASTAEMLFPPAQLLAEISQGATIPPGAVILTGTPAGVGAARTPPRFLRQGDVVEVEIERVGTLRNTVVVEE